MFTVLSVPRVSVLYKGYNPDTGLTPAGNNANLWPYNSRVETKVATVQDPVRYNIERIIAGLYAQLPLDERETLVDTVYLGLNKDEAEFFLGLRDASGGLGWTGVQREKIREIIAEKILSEILG